MPLLPWNMNTTGLRDPVTGAVAGTYAMNWRGAPSTSISRQFTPTA